MTPIHHNKTVAVPVSPAEASSLRALRTGSLSSEERAELRQHLYSVVQATPAPVSPTIFSAWQALFIRQAWAGAALAVVFVLTGSFGIARAAETALPGEALYPFKVRVNEPVVGLLRRDRESRAAWERERAERRMQEAEVLLESGRLSESENRAIDELLTEHRQTLQKYSDDSDEDFLSGTNRRGGRVKVEIEDEDGERRYALVRRTDDDGREREEDEDRSGKEGENGRSDDDGEEMRSGSDDDSSVSGGRGDNVRSTEKDSAQEKSSSSGKARSTKVNTSEPRDSGRESSGKSGSSGEDTGDEDDNKDAEKEESDKDQDENDKDEKDSDKDKDEDDEDNSGSGNDDEGV